MRSIRLASSSTLLPAILFLLLVSALIAAVQTPKGKWETLSPEGEEFKILMPTSSKQEASKEPYHRMTLNTHLYTVASEDGSVFALATLNGIKSVTTAWTETERFNSYIDAFGKWFPKKIQAKEGPSRMTFGGDLKLNGHTGREYKLSIGDMSGEARCFITRRKFYAIVVLNARGDDARVDRFFSSFSLPEKTADPAPNSSAASKQTVAPAQTNAEANSAQTESKETSNNEGQTDKKAPISGGALNGKATSLPKPEYSQEARDANASGTVTVQVTIDEEGNVIEAHAVSGNQLLRGPAELAARQAKFSPTRLLGQPVKVTGVITYNFVTP